MNLVFSFVSVLLAFQPLFLSAIAKNISMPTCPERFHCSRFGPFKYPFYNTTDDTRCGLIKVRCTKKGGEIQFGGRSYEISNKMDSGDLVIVHDRTFEQLVKNKSCEALMNNFTFPSPTPLLYNISIFSYIISLFKCTKNLNYFNLHNYNNYKCKGYNFYYKYLNGTVPNDLPVTCQVVQLPVKVPSSEHTNETNIFTLLSTFIPVEFKLSSSCKDCYSKRGLCDAESGHVQCLDVKWEEPHERTDHDNQSKDSMIKILVFIAGSTLILMLSCVTFLIWRRCKNNPFSYVSSKNKSLNREDISLSCGVSLFSYTELEDATQNFDPSHELGDGGFGAVYYGKLQDGREVAVKKLHEHNYNRVPQFRNEVEILTKLRHPNLVVLYGCTSRQSRELLLVYEYVPNGTVADHLHGEQANPTLLTWPIRLNIAIESARALVYLHSSEIIHRDVKTNNILLDQNFCVKVADFGLSRLIPNNVSHVSTAPQGTPGYVDPQYHQRYQLTDKSDVYSFGVVLIELISSMVAVDLNRSQDEIGLANFALNRIQRCAVDQLIDPVLGSDTNPEIKNMITSVAEVAFQCLQYESEMRPTMNEVLNALMDIQNMGGKEDYDRTKDFKSMSVPPPLSETNDALVLLKDFLSSPASFTSEWQSIKSASTNDGKLQDGREVALKKLHEHNYNRVQQFRNEVEILTKLRHPNLVVLYGCTSRQSRELLLVYEYVPNGTVFDHLHGEQANAIVLTWPIRLKIAVETARALVYLHSSGIIHRDVKTNNILLDHNFSVKVGDFGLSRLVSNNVSHVSTAPQGTPGYVDPQYHQRYQLTDKSDVYSFGVVLIELISSMVVVDLNRSQDEIGLANFALKRIKKCAFDQLIDPILGSNANLEIKNMITSVAEVAFQCLQYESDMRPTMNEVLDVLIDIQTEGGKEVYDTTRDFQSMNVNETNDAAVLLKDFPPSPVSVTSEWQSNNSASTTLSVNGDRL